nr:PREDICTED: glycosaminoglycan xylosylkinase [Bemisia tabaci]
MSFIRMRFNIKLCFVFLLLIIMINVLLLFAIFSQERKVMMPASPADMQLKDSKHEKGIANDFFATRIIEVSKAISKFYKVPLLNPLMKKHLDTLINDLQVHINASEKLLARSVAWVTWQELIPRQGEPLLGSVLHALKTLPISSVDNASKGTQLKLMVSFQSNLKAIFKPKWYPLNTIIEGPVYAGKDRYFGEVAAFHLSLLLGLPRAPISVRRQFNVQLELAPIASPELLKTFSNNNDNETCMYGVCYYCHPNDPVCTENGMLDGALILWLPEYMEIKKYKHPWRRTYRKNVLAKWETDSEFCAKVNVSQFYRNRPSVLLDLIDTSIFDFLIDNGDRHHFEMFANTESPVLLIDNGKSFGNPHSDHLDILAPLYQCCRIRYSTYERLLVLKGGTLSRYLSEMLKMVYDSTILTDLHLEALERRLLLVFSAIVFCIKEKGEEFVLVR